MPPVIRKAPKGPSRSWRNPALNVPPAPAVSATAPAPAVASKILVNPNFKGNKILVNPNFKPPKKILVNPAFQQPKSIHVNPKILNKPQSPKVLSQNKSPRVLFKSKNKLIMKKQLVTPVKAKTSKVSPVLFKSKNKLVRRTTAKKTPTRDLLSLLNKAKTKQGASFSIYFVAGKFKPFEVTKIEKITVTRVEYQNNFCCISFI